MKGISATGNFVLAFAGREDDLEEVLQAARPCMERRGQQTPRRAQCYPSSCCICKSAALLIFALVWACLVLMVSAWVLGKEHMWRSDAAIECLHEG